MIPMRRAHVRTYRLHRPFCRVTAHIHAIGEYPFDPSVTRVATGVVHQNIYAAQMFDTGCHCRLHLFRSVTSQRKKPALAPSAYGLSDAIRAARNERYPPDQRSLYSAASVKGRHTLSKPSTWATRPSPVQAATLCARSTISSSEKIA